MAKYVRAGMILIPPALLALWFYCGGVRNGCTRVQCLGWAVANGMNLLLGLWFITREVFKGKGWIAPYSFERFTRYFVAGSETAAVMTQVNVIGTMVGYWLIGLDGYLFVSVAGFLALCVYAYWYWRGEDRHLRGRRIVPFADAERDSWWLRPAGDDGLFWGGLYVPTGWGTKHFALIGGTGAGKTLLMRLLMQCVLPFIKPGSDRRAVVYDPKQDMVSILHGMDLNCPVKIFNALDRRAVAWDMARDCKTPAAAIQMASIMIADKNEGANQHWADTGRHMFSGVVIAFQRLAPDRWTFRDVLLALRSREWLQTILEQLPETRDRLEHLKEERHAQSILSTLVTKMANYEPIAAAWDNAPEKISLQSWIDGEFILVLGNDETARTAIDAINRVIFKRATELTLAQSESPTRQSWYFLDEAREAGRLDGLGSLLTKGRSKGACCVLGLQDVEGWREACESEKVANEILGQCSHKALLRIESPETATWASTVAGDFEHNELSITRSASSGGTTTSVTEQRVKRESVLASQFMTIPPTNPVNGLTGFFHAPDIGLFTNRITGEQLEEHLRKPSAVSNFEQRPTDEQILRPWTDADLARLGLKNPVASLPPVTTTAPVAGEAKPRLQVLKPLEQEVR